MPHNNLKSVFLAAIIVCSVTAKAQLYGGAGYGTFNIPYYPLRGTGPTLKLEYAGDNKGQVGYLDVSYFSKSADGGETDLYDNNGVPLGSAPTTDKFSYIYAQLGAKKLFSRDVDERGFTTYVGAGVAFALATIRSSYKTNYNINDDVVHFVSYGFHFNAGLQYHFKPVILELRGNLDLVLKSLTLDDGSNILTNFRLCVIVPITHD